MIHYAEFYNYERLENTARKLEKLNTAKDEEMLINLHNHLIWHSYCCGKYPDADAILNAVICEVLAEHSASIEDIPMQLRCVWKGEKEQ